MARRRGRPPGLTEARIEKRYIIARAIIAGVKIAVVARQLSVSRSWASREANSPGTRQILAELLEPYRGRIGTIWKSALEVIEGQNRRRRA